MEEIKCSVSDCGEPVLGKGVVIGSLVPDDRLDFEAAHLSPYEGSKEPFAIVHPNCFLSIFHEMTMIEDGAMGISVYVASVGDIRLALAM